MNQKSHINIFTSEKMVCRYKTPDDVMSIISSDYKNIIIYVYDTWIKTVVFEKNMELLFL